MVLTVCDSALIPRVGHLDLLSKLFGGIVEPFEAGGTTNGGLRLDVAETVATTDAGRQETETGIV